MQSVEISGSALTEQIPGKYPQFENLSQPEKVAPKPETSRPVEKNLTEKPEVKSSKNEPQPIQANLGEVVQELNKHLNIFNTRLSFSFDRENEMTVIRIEDEKTGELIKQVPPQEMLDSLRKMADIVGLLLDRSI